MKKKIEKIDRSLLYIGTHFDWEVEERERDAVLEKLDEIIDRLNTLEEKK